jgi:hypothetical protein
MMINEYGAVDGMKNSLAFTKVFIQPTSFVLFGMCNNGHIQISWLSPLISSTNTDSLDRPLSRDITLWVYCNLN